MTSDKPNQTGTTLQEFLNAHKKPLTKREEFKLKDRERHRKSYATKSNLKWKENKDG